MELHQLKSNNLSRYKKRVGRGGKRGTTSGRGQKGQKSRSGHRIRPAVRDIINRLPKWRGFHNKTKRPKPVSLNTKELKNLSGIIDIESLKKAGLVDKKYKGKVKILSGGEAKKWQIKGLLLSKDAKDKIEKAGGEIQK